MSEIPEEQTEKPTALDETPDNNGKAQEEGEGVVDPSDNDGGDAASVPPSLQKEAIPMPPLTDPETYTQTFNVVLPTAFGSTVQKVDFIEARLAALESSNSEVEARVEAMLNKKLGPFMSAMEAKIEGLVDQVEGRVQEMKDGLTGFEAQMAEELKAAQVMREELNNIDAEGLDKAHQRVDELMEALKKCEAADDALRYELEKAVLESAKATASVAVEAAEALQRSKVDLQGQLADAAQEVAKQGAEVAANAEAAAAASCEAQQAQASADGCLMLLEGIAKADADRVDREAGEAVARKASAVEAALQTKAELDALEAKAKSMNEALAARVNGQANAIVGLQVDVAVLGADAHHHDSDEVLRSDKVLDLKQRFAEAMSDQQFQNSIDHLQQQRANIGGYGGGEGEDGGGDLEEKEGGGAGVQTMEGGGGGVVQRVLTDAFGGIPQAHLADPEVVAEHDKLMRAMLRKVNAQGRCLEGLVSDAKWRLEQERLAREKNDGIAVQCLSCLRPAPESLPRLREALNFGGVGDSNGGYDMFSSGNNQQQQQQQQQRLKSARARGSGTAQPPPAAAATTNEHDLLFSNLPQPATAPLRGRQQSGSGGAGGAGRSLSQGTPPGGANGVFVAGGPGMTQRQQLGETAAGVVNPGSSNNNNGENGQRRTESPTNFDELLDAQEGFPGNPADTDSGNELWEQMVKDTATPGDKVGENKYLRAYHARQQEIDKEKREQQQEQQAHQQSQPLFPQRKTVTGQRGLSGGAVRPSSANASSKAKRGGSGSSSGGFGGGSGGDGEKRPQSAGGSRKSSGGAVEVAPMSRAAGGGSGGLSFVEMQWKSEKERTKEGHGGWAKLV